MSVRSVNKAIILGNLTRDPELRYTPSGTAVVSFSVATNREYTPSNSSETVENTEFHNVVAWAKLAELCDKLLNKGDKVYIEGRLQTSTWEDEASGKKMYKTEIVANEMILVSSRRGSEASQDTDSSFAAQAPDDTISESSQITEDTQPVEDEIPF